VRNRAKLRSGRGNVHPWASYFFELRCSGGRLFYDVRHLISRTNSEIQIVRILAAALKSRLLPLPVFQSSLVSDLASLRLVELSKQAGCHVSSNHGHRTTFVIRRRAWSGGCLPAERVPSTLGTSRFAPSSSHYEELCEVLAGRQGRLVPRLRIKPPSQEPRQPARSIRTPGIAFVSSRHASNPAPHRPPARRGSQDRSSPQPLASSPPASPGQGRASGQRFDEFVTDRLALPPVGPGLKWNLFDARPLFHLTPLPPRRLWSIRTLSQSPSPKAKARKLCNAGAVVGLVSGSVQAGRSF
jgi:hypothetical protein